jgi:CrcB protein
MMQGELTYIFAALGGALGTIARVMLSTLMSNSTFFSFPLPILVVNSIGCFLMGACVEWATAYSLSAYVRTFWTVGFLGGFTTFSAFSVEFFLLFERRHFGVALGYGFATLFLTLMAFFLGMRLMRLCL